jgi:hypothetical protein
MPNGTRSTDLRDTAEGRRLHGHDGPNPWRRWGPYLSERQWGTVREDYSAHGDAWNDFPFTQASSRAYRWGEDGIAGFADDDLRWCLSLALWNGVDPILKERLFGLTNEQGNHGEDVKELYYYLDAVPTHSYMRMLYKYPHVAYPYEALVEENGRRTFEEPEYELIDTGLFEQGRYFDVEIEYAKAAPSDILMVVTVTNRGPEKARLHVLPQIWARNDWSWSHDRRKPELRALSATAIAAVHPDCLEMRLHAEGASALLFCDNDTNVPKLYGAEKRGYFKDGIEAYVVRGDAGAVNPALTGTKCAVHHVLEIPAGGASAVRVRLRAAGGEAPPFVDFDAVVGRRREEANEFYGVLQGGIADEDARRVQRQALAGLIWSKQLYHYDVREWLQGDPAHPPPPLERKSGRNADWRHLRNRDVISMPDKWEYPWYASWDLAFQTLPMAMIDSDFAKRQLLLLTRDWYMHPNAQLPAYEYSFSDANPPVHAWAAWRVYLMDRAQTGRGDREFLARIFQRLMLNFTWWVNRRDPEGRNIFQGGFLGLDNIAIFDRSLPLPHGYRLSQSDGTAWMAMYALDLMRIAIELAYDDPIYEDIAGKLVGHFLLIAEAVADHGSLWDDVDAFFYDVIEAPGGERIPLRARSLVGLIPLCAVEVITSAGEKKLSGFGKRLRWLAKHRPDLINLVSYWKNESGEEALVLSLTRGSRLKKLLKRMLDETEFLSAYGIRSVSKHHEHHPFVLEWNGRRTELPYWPGESRSKLFGGNSNWRGPIWMPLNYLLIEALREYHSYYTDEFKVECPTGSGTFLTLAEVADELSRRLTRLFLRDETGRRPVHGDCQLHQEDAAFRDNVFFYEHFHGDTGRGLGASHQTGWSALVALLIDRVNPGG